MPLSNKNHYDLVSDDGYDSRIPLHNEEAFQHGISFQAKYIGTLDVPRPSSRVEIVAAMRRIRYEFKAKAIKKKKINLVVSVDGVKVLLRKKKRRKAHWALDESRLMLMHHPIYRIFYVSHDSQDLKIFSYIARDGSTNVFKCNVFKAYKKSQAMRIVRSIGQAFEVCHKISLQAAAETEEANDAAAAADDEKSSEDNDNRVTDASPMRSDKLVLFDASPIRATVSQPVAATIPKSPSDDAFHQAQTLLNAMSSQPQTVGTISSPSSPPLGETPYPTATTSVTPSSMDIAQLPLSSHHQMQLQREQLEQQLQQTQIAMSHIHLLKDQLTAETAARIEAQARTHQLMLQNRELLEHINALVGRLQELEMQVSGASYGMHALPSLRSQVPVLTEPHTPEPGPLLLPPDLTPSSLAPTPNTQEEDDDDDDQVLFENNIQSAMADSPDSGHREMSSDSLSNNLCQPEGSTSDSWYTPMKTKLCGLNQESENEQTASSRRDFTLPLRNNNNNANPFSLLDSNANTTTAIITPLPMIDATGNRLDLNVTPPRIDPPPRVLRKRSSREVLSPDSNGNSSGSNRSSTASSLSEHSDGSSRALCQHLNNLSLCSKQQQHQQTLSKHLRLSFSDEENGAESSEDSGLPRQSSLKATDYTDFENLGSR